MSLLYFKCCFNRLSTSLSPAETLTELGSPRFSLTSSLYAQ